MPNAKRQMPNAKRQMPKQMPKQMPNGKNECRRGCRESGSLFWLSRETAELPAFRGGAGLAN
jgi:hypothetical protein